LANVLSLLDKVFHCWDNFLTLSILHSEVDIFRRLERTERPLSEKDFTERLEAGLSGKLALEKLGPKKR
jgi:hypothetical protein